MAGAGNNAPISRSRWRYVPPNALTSANIAFGLMSIAAAHRGSWVLSGWMIIYAVLTDRLDGIVVRKLHASSEFGMQLDSFADFLNFGVAPAFLLDAYLDARADLPYAHGDVAHVLLMSACAVYVLGAVFRLARYNITSSEDTPTTIFFGVPSTMAGGMVAIWFLALLKYDPSSELFSGPKVWGHALTTPLLAWRYSPIALLVGAYLMVSSLPMPKGNKAPNKAVGIFLGVNLLLGYALGFLRLFPEIMLIQPTLWLLIFLVWGQVSKSARGLTPPRVFP